MVCNRCKLIVKNELGQLQLHPLSVNLGEVDIEEQTLSQDELTTINDRLATFGFELIDDRKSRISEQIKTTVINMVHYPKEETRLKHSEYIAQQLHYDYPYLSRLFSEVEGVTIEQYLISQRIEKVKELLVYDELSLSEIADRLGYSSVAHLSAQFKKITGLTPSFYKNSDSRSRQELDNIGKTRPF
jgi:AraC-like DNA-binding protein